MEYVSLLPPEIKQRRLEEKRQGRLIKIAVIALAVVLAVYVFLLASTLLTRSTLNSLQEERQQLEDQAAELEEYANLYNEMSEAEDRLNRAMGNVPDWDQLLRDLGMALNPEGALTELDISYQADNNADGEEDENEESGSFDMRGWSYSHGNVADIIERVQRLEQLNNVRFRVSSETTINNRQAVQFTVDATLVPGPVFFDPEEDS